MVGLVFTSCEPMEDIHERIGSDIDRTVVGQANVVLEGDDYAEFGDDEVEENEYFNSIEQANQLIPDYLSATYPVWGSGSIANVEVNMLNPEYTQQTVEESFEYEVTEEDYEALEFRFPNFSRESHISQFLDYKYPDAESGTVVELTYDYYSGGSTTTRTTTHVLVGDDWEEALTLERSDYIEMGESYPNFSSRADAVADLGVYLGRMFPYAQPGDTRAVIYDLHIGGGNTIEIVETFTYNGDRWTAPNEVISTVLQFGHNGSEWEPDNTIVYTLTAADYAMVGNSQYGNFNYWDEDDYEEAFEKIVTILETRFPDAEPGQKFVVNFLGYAGSVSTYTERIIVNENGEFVRNE